MLLRSIAQKSRARNVSQENFACLSVRLPVLLLIVQIRASSHYKVEMVIIYRTPPRRGNLTPNPPNAYASPSGLDFHFELGLFTS